MVKFMKATKEQLHFANGISIEELARKHSLSRLDCVQFRKKRLVRIQQQERPGSQCDDHFPLRKCSTFKFGFYRARKRSKLMSYSGFAIKRPKAIQEIPIQAQKRETDPFDWRYTNANEFTLCVKFDDSWVGYSVPSFPRNMTDRPGYKRQALMSNATSHNGCVNTPNTTLGTVANTEVAGFQRENARSYDKAVRPGRTLNGFLYPMEGRPCEGTFRPAQPPRMRLGFSH
ncbi:hypothetical protein AB3S75_020390 [Citrus x aurantiifolia]